MSGVWAWVGFAVHAVSTAFSAAATPFHGVNWNAVAIGATVVGTVAAVIAVVPVLRNAVAGAWRRVLRRLGVPRSRYAKRFAKVYGSYVNPYLNREERLDLHSTYVPLSFRGEDDQQQHVRPAAEVLAEPSLRRTVIIGSPGSGKSTLLQAHGVGLLDSRGSRRAEVIPFLVRLRDLATFLDPDVPRTLGENVLADYLVREVLVKEEFFPSRERAAEFVHDTLASGSALVMLDGLDEVPDTVLSALLSAVDDFMTDGTEAHPTRRARILLTCRTQNFDVLGGGWIDSAFAPYDVFALAPLGDRDIMAYLGKFGHRQWFPALRRQPPLFTTEQGPQRFFDAILEDDKIDLLRVPLILAMAVSLYAETPELIPSTIGKLYQDMLEEMLDRHSFGAAPGETGQLPGTRRRRRAAVRGHAAQRRRNAQSRYSLNEFQAVDKYSLLRQFALEATRQTGDFGDFTRESLEKFAADRADSLNMVGKPDAFVEEIITHSGLVTTAGRDELWHYAHRSLQEFLAAQELRLDGAAEFLLEKANSVDWRQAVQFYAAGQESRQIDDFLLSLATRNVELAVRCLQVCRPSLTAARQVLQRLTADSRDAVTALAAATRCPLAAVRDLAITRLKEAILDPRGVFSDVGFEIEEMLPLLDSLTRTNAAGIAAVLPAVIDRLPDDPRLIRPLWQCLGADGFEDHLEESRRITGRLLRLAVDREAFAALADQGRRDPEFLASYRKQAYPFKRGLDHGHNLVTLLAWADYLASLGREVDLGDIQEPSAGAPVNLFWEAREHGKLRTLEDDKRRTISFSLCWPARAVSALSLIGAISAAGIELAEGAGQSLENPLDQAPLMLLLGFAYVPALVALVYAGLSSGYLAYYYCFTDRSHRCGNVLLAFSARFPGGLTVLQLLAYTFVPAAFGLSAFVLAGGSAAEGWLLSFVQLVFWATGVNFFSGNVRFYPYWPNEYVRAYDDLESRHWLVPEHLSQSWHFER